LRGRNVTREGAGCFNAIPGEIEFSILERKEDSMIEVRDLKKSYGSLTAVNGVSFRADKGEIVGLLGPNGAGKTTIIKILTCYHYPSEGKATVAGLDVEEDPLGVKRKVGYLPESAPLYLDLTVEEYLDFIAESRGLDGEEKTERVGWAVKECGLESVYGRPIEQLSKGYRQRVGLAQAILHDPEILILDEPTTGLDPNQILEIRDLIKKLGKEKLVILSTHILQEVEALCGRVMILNQGRIAAQGTAEEIALSLKGETVFDVVLKGDRSDLRAAVGGIGRSLPGYSLKRKEEAGGGKLVLELSAPPDADGETLFDWAVSSKAKILEMAKRKTSLEDIFVSLTKEGEKA
jgi:ABC-2 type transport system ATP-binding protein